MAYKKRGWSPTTPLSVDNMEAMDEGIYQNSVDNESLKTSVENINTQLDKGFLPADTTIAGLNAKGNITVDQLITALQVYPTIIDNVEPALSDAAKIAKQKQLFVDIETGNLYVCNFINSGGKREWILVGDKTHNFIQAYLKNLLNGVLCGTQEEWISGDVSTQGEVTDSSYAIMTRDKIDLSTVSDQLKIESAENVLFKIAYYDENDNFVSLADNWTSSVILDKAESKKILVKAIHNNDSSGNKVALTPEDFEKISITIIKENGDEFSDQKLSQAIENYFVENPIPESSDSTKEILEFSQSAIPNTIKWVPGYLNASAVEQDSSQYYRSDYVEIDNAFSHYLYVNNTTDKSQSMIYFMFDENKSLIGARVTINVDAHTSKEITPSVIGVKYIRLCIPIALKDCLIRFYCKEQITHTTKKELKKATYGQPRNLSMLDYFGANKKVVLIGDSFTQGLGSSEYVLKTTTNEDGNSVTLTGNYPDYGIEHNLPQYEIGKKLHSIEGKVWYEAIDGNGYAHRLKNYLQNKFGCTVNNYGMSGITSGRLLSQEMTSETSELVTASEGTVRVFQGLTKGFDTVFITIGGNDRGIASIDAFVYNLNWIVNYLINTDHKKVILMSMTPCENDNEMPHSMFEIDEKIQEIAETYDVPFVSCYHGMLEYCAETSVDISTLRNSDGLHPNDEGYAVVESIVCEQLGIVGVDKSYVDNSFVEKTLTIAGLSLERPIKPDALREALNTVLISTRNPTEYDTVGTAGQLCAVYDNDEETYHLYLCRGKKEDGFYGNWKPVNTIGDLSDYATVEYVDSLVSDIDKTLDSIIAIQENLIGGATV